MPKLTWTNEEVEFLKNNYTSLSNEEISNILGTHTAKAIETKMQKLKLYRGHFVKYSFDDVVQEMDKRGYILLSDKSEYINACSKIRYLCPQHIDKGEQSISLGHLIGGRGCWFCGHTRTGLNRRFDLSDLYESDKQHCLDMNFEYIKTYRTTNKKGHSTIVVDFICNKHRQHGIQSVLRDGFYRLSCGCKYCSGKELDIEDLNGILHLHSPDIDIIERPDKLLYFSKFHCNICNTTWDAVWKPTRTCPTCNPNSSTGEMLVKQFLDNKNISYIEQHKFDNCKNINTLSFDFYLPNNNVCIEYQGIQHYKPIDYFGGETAFNSQSERDNIKRNYCKDNNLQLIEIPYTIDDPNKMVSFMSKYSFLQQNTK